MIKASRIFGLLITSSVLLIGCGESQIEKDAKEAADLICQSRNTEVSDFNKKTELTAKAAKFRREMAEKYTSESDDKQFEKAFRKALETCKK